jgi:putative DNA-invertase from lambdoid prophage Rac
MLGSTDQGGFSCPHGYGPADPDMGPRRAVLWSRHPAQWTVFQRTSPLRTYEHWMATILYARVSTADQTLDHQRIQAELAGFKLDQVIADHGVSGVTKALRERPEGRRLFDMLRAGDILVVRWVDRLGRNYQDVTDNIREFIRRGVTVRTVINGLVFDGTTKDPMQAAVRDALVAFMAATAQAQAEATKEAQKAGIAHARAVEGQTKYRGRKPTFTPDEFAVVRDLLGQGFQVGAVVKATGLKRQTIYRIKNDPAGQRAALAAWYPTAVSRPIAGREQHI